MLWNCPYVESILAQVKLVYMWKMNPHIFAGGNLKNGKLHPFRQVHHKSKCMESTASSPLQSKTTLIEEFPLCLRPSQFVNTAPLKAFKLSAVKIVATNVFPSFAPFLPSSGHDLPLDNM